MYPAKGGGGGDGWGMGPGGYMGFPLSISNPEEGLSTPMGGEGFDYERDGLPGIAGRGTRVTKRLQGPRLEVVKSPFCGLGFPCARNPLVLTGYPDGPACLSGGRFQGP